VNSLLDTTHGTVRMSSARNAAATQLQTGTFRGGAFIVKQPRSSALTTLTLAGGGNFKTGCRGTSRKASAARRRPRRSLFSNAKGRFRTRGRNSTATVRGTIWLTKDTCAGTLTRVSRGVVVVRDLVKRRNIKVKAHHAYLARRR
jgi:hypothetical protein